MGRMDGDMVFNSVDEAGTIEGWRRECERLRRENERITAQVDELEARHVALISEYNDRVFERDKLSDECERLKADSVAEFHLQARRDLADENEALRIIVKHLADLL